MASWLLSIILGRSRWRRKAAEVQSGAGPEPKNTHVKAGTTSLSFVTATGHSSAPCQIWHIMLFLFMSATQPWKLPTHLTGESLEVASSIAWLSPEIQRHDRRISSRNRPLDSHTPCQSFTLQMLFCLSWPTARLLCTPLQSPETHGSNTLSNLFLNKGV